MEQSLWNGGGPACLRLRGVMTDEELSACHQGVVFTDELHLKLRKWVKKYYVGNLIYENLFVPSFIKRCRTSLDELTDIMDLGKIYPFQKK